MFTTTSNLLTLAVVGLVAFSVLHAKDVRAAAALPSLPVSYQAVRGFDNPIHLEFHNHVDRQSLSSLLGSMNQDKPLTTVRHMKKTYINEHKKTDKLRDSALGLHVPRFA